jgi:hypothetical protein
VSNSYYNGRHHGEPAGCDQRFEGVALGSVVIGCMIIPFVLFSDAFSFLTAYNPVKDASISLDFVVRKRVFQNILTEDIDPEAVAGKDLQEYEELYNQYKVKFCKGHYDITDSASQEDKDNCHEMIDKQKI